MEQMILTCPVCKNYLTPPIRQCEKFHNFCEKCVQIYKLSICVVCEGKIINDKNNILEKLLKDARYPCSFEQYGCTYSIPISQKSEHEKECYHRMFTCESKIFCKESCTWEGLYKDILMHFKKNHPKSTVLNFREQITIPYAKKNISELQLISAFNKLFWYKYRVDTTNSVAYWTIQYIGPKKHALSYYYELEFFNDYDPIRKYKITEVCGSDTEDVNALFQSHKCVAISLKALKNFADANNNISFRFWVHKVRPDGRSSDSLSEATNKVEKLSVTENKKHEASGSKKENSDGGSKGQKPNKKPDNKNKYKTDQHKQPKKAADMPPLDMPPLDMPTFPIPKQPVYVMASSLGLGPDFTGFPGLMQGNPKVQDQPNKNKTQKNKGNNPQNNK